MLDAGMDEMTGLDEGMSFIGRGHVTRPSPLPFCALNYIHPASQGKTSAYPQSSRIYGNCERRPENAVESWHRVGYPDCDEKCRV